MLHLMRSMAVGVAAAGLMIGGATATIAAPKGACVKKAAEGTGSDEKAAKFQVDEALLQAVDWGAWAGRHPDRNAALLEHVLDRIADGRLHPVEPVTYPLEDAARALQDLADRRVAGKVALVP